jgi:hypothetical protein
VHGLRTGADLHSRESTIITFAPKRCREEKENAGPKCKEQITRVELDAANDFQLDRQLYGACKADADKWCAGVENKDGAIQECLVRSSITR